MSEIDELRAIVIAQGRALSELREEMSFHRGIDSGQSSIYSPHPNISIATGEFGGGRSRLDSNGIQIRASGGSEESDNPLVYFVNEFTLHPENLTVYGLIGALTTASAASILIHRQTSGTRYGLIQMEASDIHLTHSFDGNTAVLKVLGSSATPYVGVSDGSGAGVAFWLGPMTSDPASPVDGMKWYRSDTDKFRGRANGATDNFAMEAWVTAGFMAAGVPILGSGSELTIASGAVTATSGYHRIDTQSDDASDELDTISGGTTGQLLVLRAENAARTVVVKDNTGNIQLDGSADFSLDAVEDTITLIYNGSSWLEISRSDNA